MTGNKVKPPSISVFFPAYNDERSIATLVRHALEVLPALTDDYEVIVVNDGSADQTAEVLRVLASEYNHLRVVTHEKNSGYGAALRSGFAAARKDLIFYTDGDLQYDVRELPMLFALFDDGCDIVNGFKNKRSDRLNRKLAGGFYNRLMRLLFALPISDVDCDFRLMRRRLVQSLELTSKSGSICVELVYKLKKAGARFRETAVTHHERPYGKSQFFTFRRVSKTLFDIGSLWLELNVFAKRKIS